MKTLISLRWFVLVLLLAGPWPTAFAVEGLCAATPDGFRPITREAGRPKFNIPPDSPLARNEHPRFLLTKADLEVLRQRLADGRLAAEFQAVKRQAEGAWGSESSGWKHALLWRLTGDPKYLESIRAAVDPYDVRSEQHSIFEGFAEMPDTAL
jgi:hypothetical protein